jgi:uncharacterized protein (DUF1697 family)
MKTYIALLRGINVGGKVLKMADLKAAVAPLGFGDIQTYLQSGNMVFRSVASKNASLAGRISDAIRDHAEIAVTVMVRDADQWSRIIAANPFAEASTLPKTVHAFILDQTPEPSRIQTLDEMKTGREAFQIIENTLYLHTPDGFGKSKLADRVERVLKVPMTARNWNTVLALGTLSGTIATES